MVHLRSCHVPDCEAKMMRVTSCTIPIQEPLIVETGTAKAAEWQGCQEAGAVNLSLHRDPPSDSMESGHKLFLASARQTDRITIRFKISNIKELANSWQWGIKSKG